MARTGARVPVLQDLSLVVPAGQLLAILGPSGCGKTTLLRLLAGLLAPTEGRVSLHGEPPVRAQQRRAIGWLAQDDGLFPWRTVRDNVALPLQVRGGRADPAAIAAVLARVGLAEAATRYPHELSGGMRQRAALARALVTRPAFLLLDEPFAHLDELTRERLGDLLLALRTPETTSVLVTHSVPEAARLADRVLVLSPRPARVALDCPVRLPHPRREDDPPTLAISRALRAALACEGSAGGPEPAA